MPLRTSTEERDSDLRVTLSFLYFTDHKLREDFHRFLGILVFFFSQQKKESVIKTSRLVTYYDQGVLLYVASVF